ncbi:hypothetical protein BsWGS_13167 [Bradybaena similaris]
MNKLTIHVALLAAIVVVCCSETTTTADPCAGPIACPFIFKQVCGSDGLTYSNSCELKARTCGHGVTVAHEGPCDETTPAHP